MWILFLLTLLNFDLAVARNSQPEYVTLSEEEIETFDDPTQIDAEYESDIRTFQFEIRDTFRYLTNPAAAEMNAGSISNKKFAYYQRAKIVKDSGALSAKFSQANEADLDQSISYEIFEATYSGSDRLRFGVYGQPSHQKRKNDLGFTVISKILNQNIRFFYTMVDFTRGDHNDRADYFQAGHEAKSFGLLGLSTQNQLQLRYFFRIEPEVVWIYPTENQERKFQRTEIGLEFLNENQSLELNFQEKFKGLTNANGGRTIWTQNVFAQYSKILSQFEPGIRVHRRSYFTSRGNLVHLNVLPFLDYKWIFNSEQSIVIGYQMNQFYSSGAQELKGNGLPTEIDEHRMNLQWRYNHDALTLRAQLTFDVDAIWRDTGYFEGGHGYIGMYF